MRSNPLIVILVFFFALGCAQEYTFIDKVDVDGDSKIDVVRYFNGDTLIKEERLNLRPKSELNPTIVYFKKGFEVTIDGEQYAEQKVDARKTYGKNARWGLGAAYFYTKDKKVAFTKVTYKNGVIDTVDLKNPDGTSERAFENFNHDAYFDRETIYKNGKPVDFKKIHLPTDTPIGELRKM